MTTEPQAAPALVVSTQKAALDELVPYPGNARRGDVELVAESLRVNGQYKPIVAQVGTSHVLAGNHTVEAARSLGWTELLVSWVSCDDETARRINLVDNRSNDVAGYDDEALADLLRELGGDYEGTGFDAETVDELLTRLGPGGYGAGGLIADDDAPPVPAEPVTRLGDFLELGPHVLLCGDALDGELREKLLRGERASLVVTDPPYTVNYEENLSPIQAKYRRQDGKKVEGDAIAGAEADAFIDAAMAAVRDVLAPGGVFYVFSPPGVDELRFRLGLAAAPLQIRQVLLWLKDRFVFGRQDYHWRHESIMYGWREGKAHFFIGDFTQDNCWEYERPARSDEHPTMKPVAMLQRAITNSSRPGELVVDLFGGSGSTLVAAAAEGRRCAMMELDPGYCDVIVARWEKLTGTVVSRG